MDEIKNWLKRYSSRIFNSIAFYPALISIAGFIVALLLFNFDASDIAKELKSQYKWLEINDADTARSIISSVAAGMISLTVFSFSMVMIVLTRAATQMSNRILDNLIGNRFQQFCLGFYIGTIIYSFFLLSVIRDSKSYSEIPSISILFLTVLTVTSLFIFIYFLHYVTQSVKYDNIIKRTYRLTEQSLQMDCFLQTAPSDFQLPDKKIEIRANSSGVFQGFNQSLIEKKLAEHACHIYFVKPKGCFILKGETLGYVDRLIDVVALKSVEDAIYIDNNESIQKNFNFGFQQLTEIAIKALSPGINDPGTAIISLRSLTILLTYRLNHFPQNTFYVSRSAAIYQTNRSFEEIFEVAIYPILDYGKKDRLLLLALKNAIAQLEQVASMAIFDEVKSKIEEKIKAL